MTGLGSCSGAGCFAGALKARNELDNTILSLFFNTTRGGTGSCHMDSEECLEQVRITFGTEICVVRKSALFGCVGHIINKIIKERSYFLFVK